MRWLIRGNGRLFWVLAIAVMLATMMVIWLF